MSTQPGDWPAPHLTTPVDATVTLPGSKSLTNRYLVLAAMANDTSRIRRPLRSRDTLLMAAGLRSMGVAITDHVCGDGQVDWVVEPAPLRGPAQVDCGLAGTVMRFLPAVAPLADGPVAFDGDPQARTRPVGPVLGALRRLGVDVRDDGRGALPFTVAGAGRARGGDVTLDASQSSQFVSALLLAGSRYDGGITVRHAGPQVPSLPHIRMTVEVLRDAGAMVDDSESATAPVWRVEPSEIRALDVVVEPDLSNAAAFLAAAMVSGGRVHVPGWPQHTTQPGDDVRAIFEQQGATVTLDRSGLTVVGPQRVRGIDIDLHDASELTPTVAAVAAFADSPTTIRGVAHIRGHETDRITALVTELTRLGGDATETDDGLVVRPARLRGGRVRTYADHRMATAAALIGLAVPGVVVEDVATTAKTLPDFVRAWEALVQTPGQAAGRPHPQAGEGRHHLETPVEASR